MSEHTRRGPWALGVLAATLAAGLAWLGDRPRAEEPRAAASPPAFDALGTEFTGQIRPLLQRYCLDCHSAEALEGELDLERFAAIGDVRKATRTWLKVVEMLDNGEMPPKEGRRLPKAERAQIRGWIDRYLKAEAQASAGDPGPVVLRRLSNAEYTYSVRDLTGVELSPAREFPADGAAGEGFTNAGNALVMSPALLTKYLDAGKEIAAHAVLVPDGLHFSAGTTRRDWTDEILGRIRDLYAKYTDSGGATTVNLQGIVFGTNGGGRLPLERYLAATLAERDALTSGAKSIDTVARDHKLSPKYLGLLWKALTDRTPSPLIDGVRLRWQTAKASDAPAIASDVAAWQNTLWKFNSVGHIGKVGGPTAWMEPLTPLATRQDVRLPIPANASANGEVTLYLTARDAGDGNAGDSVIWERPRLVMAGQPDLPLRDVRGVARELASLRARTFAATAASLAAAAEVADATQPPDVAKLAKAHDVAPEILSAWLDYLGIGDGGGSVHITSHLTAPIQATGGYDFVKGYGSGATPNVVANSTDRHVRIPGNLKGHGVAMHPSPTLRIAAGWRSPVAATVKVAATIQHAHPECGNGVTWTLELRRGATRRRLAAGIAQGARVVKPDPIEGLAARPGDVLALLVGPRDGNHACDLTAVDLSISGGGKDWDLAADVSPDMLAGNPHADRHGNEGVWHFYTEPDKGSDALAVVPPGSALARWQSADAAGKAALAREVQALLTGPAPSAKDSPDALLHRQLSSLRGPLFRAAREALAAMPPASRPVEAGATAFGLDPERFGQRPDGAAIDPASLSVAAPGVVEIRLPADLAEGCELVTAGALASDAAGRGSVQLQATLTKPGPLEGVTPGTPIVAAEGSAARTRFATAFEDYRRLFPPALCYTKIVPVDEVVTLTLFYREDEPLRRLMLDEAETQALERLWDQLHYVSQDALTLVDAFQQLLEYASQDGDPKLFEPLRGPITKRAEDYRKRLIETEPAHVEAVVRFASQADRRPLTDAEAAELRSLYRTLRSEGLPHDEAIRLLIARVFVSPAFLYRVESPAPGTVASPVSDWELATRLSYFLWSSVPDEELRAVAASGRLRDPQVLARQTRRMLGDPKVRRLATEFACQWLHVYEFDALDEKSERHFPTFAALRDDMYEETIQFFTDLFRSDAPALAWLDADHTFLNEALAKHYGIPGVTGPEWRKVSGLKAQGRGGILGLATTLAKQSGASRTSPILRGNWVSEVLLGEKLPRPPKDVPQLPNDEAETAGLTVRQLVEKHSSDPRCSGCHKRVDPLGFSLEGYDAIGRKRDKDLAGRAVETNARLQDGTAFEGLEGLRTYLLHARRDSVARQFHRKLLGYALGRGVRLSDEPLLDEIQSLSRSKEARLSDIVETIVLSRQFRDIRGQDAPAEDEL